MPRSRSRNRWPDCVPGGTRTRAGPSSDGTSNLAPKRRLMQGDRHDDMQIVALASEQRMRLDPDGDVQIAAFAAVASDVALAGHPNRATRQPGRRGKAIVSGSVRVSTCLPPQVGQRV